MEEKKVVVITSREIGGSEIDNESDLRDIVEQKLKVSNYKEIFSEWTDDGKYYVMVVKV